MDHGKTSLVKLLTGCDTDRLEEEKRRGLTIELGFAPCRMGDGGVVGVVDVPGHVDFIKNMVAGAHGIDVVILVVAADDGVMPQTREHLDILTILGVKTGLVALTKIDLVDPELRELVCQDIRKLLAGTFLADAPICPLSNITGEGYDAFFDALNETANNCPPKQTAGLFRMWVERAFNVHGFGLVASGIPAAGTVRVGDHLRLLPSGAAGRVRSMEVYGATTDHAGAGQCVALNLADLPADSVVRGSVLTNAEELNPATMFEAQLQILPQLATPLKDYAEVHLHIGTAEAMANVALLAGKSLAPGESAAAQIRIKMPLAVAPGERLVIRGMLEDGRLTTLGGGRVLSSTNTRLRRNRPWVLESLARRNAALDDEVRWCAAVLQEATEPLTAAALAAKCLQPLEKTAAILDELVKKGEAVKTVSGQFVHRSIAAAAQHRVLEELKKFHDSNPMREGVERAALLAAAALGGAMGALALDLLTAAKKITLQGDIISLAGRGANISSEEDTLCRKLCEMLEKAHLEPPLPTDLAAALRVDEKRLQRIIQLLVDRQEVVRLDPKVVMHRRAVEAGVEVVKGLFSERDSFETVEFRDKLGVSRKFAVPLLDYFDTQRLTTRSGNRRRAGSKLRPPK